MDIKSVSKLLKKINRLYELVNELGEASATEKDLLKAYVVDLYDAVISDDEDVAIDLEKAEMLKKLKKQRKLEKKLRKNKEKESMPAAAPVSVVQPEPVVEHATKQTPTVEPVKIEKESAPAVPSALTELFEINKGNEISDKLSQSPIKDLTKSLSINEKIFTMNELFGGNQTEMDNILTALNGLSSFDEAKDVLMRSVATKYNWSDASKAKKAKTFIKHVLRRYN